MKIYGTIYKITNTVNNKSYIGLTTASFKRRYGGETIKHVYKNTHSYILKGAIDKYGFDAFEIIQQLDVAYSKEELQEKEIYYIKKFDSVNNGYNLQTGGFIGGFKCGEEHHLYKPIVLVNTMELFETTFKAGERYNVPNQNIYACCHGLQRTAGVDKNGNKLLWRFLDDIEVVYEGEELQQYVDHIIYGEGIYCLNDGKKFLTNVDALEHYGISDNVFYRHLRGEISGCRSETGEMLCFAREYKYISMSEYEKDIMIIKSLVGYHTKDSWIIDTLTMNVFKQKRKLSKMYGVSRPTLDRMIKHKERFMMVSEYEEQFGEIRNLWDLVVDDEDEFEIVC